MAHAPNPSEEKRFTGRHMLMIVLAFFGTIIVVNATLAVFASRSWTGLVVANSYVASQNYNRKLAEARQQEALGWTATLNYQDNHIAVRMVDAAGRPRGDLSVTVSLMRPTHERDDHTLTLRETEAGLFIAPDALAPGAWNAEINATDRANRPYRQVHRLWVAAK